MDFIIIIKFKYNVERQLFQHAQSGVDQAGGVDLGTWMGASIQYYGCNFGGTSNFYCSY